MNLEEAFEDWWRVNHPHDWFAKERDGESLSYPDRTLIWWYVKNAWIEAYRAGMTRAAEICKNEEVDYASTGAQEDLAYNTAIEHAMAAILTERDKGTQDKGD